MPSLVIAVRTVAPAGTVTSWPSTVSVICSSMMSSFRQREYLEGAQHGRGRGLPQSADRGVGHGQTQVAQQLGVVGPAVSHGKAVQDLYLTLGADAAGNALAT